MEQVFVKDLKQHLDKEVLLKGWIYNLRSSGKIMFWQFRDGTSVMQVVVSQDEVDEKIWEEAQKVTIESSVVIKGKVTKHPKKEEYEVQLSGLTIVQISEEYPIGKKEHGPDFLLTNRHLWLRSPRQWAIQRVRNVVINAMYEYLNNKGFIKIDAPILTPNACEGTTTLFEVDYFDQGKAYLSQSGQLYIEAAIFSVGRCFDFGPTFRAEKSKTRRHLTEFWMMDAEAAFVEHEESMKIQEGNIRHIIRKVLAECDLELDILKRDKEALKRTDNEFKIMTYHDTIEFLRSKGSDIKVGEDLGADDETILTAESDVPVFVEKWPKEIKAFYMKQDPENPAVYKCSDLVATEGYGEVIGGSQREDDYDLLLERMKKEKLPIADYQWYLDLRRYGSVPHSGYGIGLERTVGWMCGIRHIRETIPFPRMISRIYP
ncbi:asparagine--tRNA ligase [Patescibacteria group bacterium]|nr:asparagine--tRNA ligase [Patescibacteria group bacterium]